MSCKHDLGPSFEAASRIAILIARRFRLSPAIAGLLLVAFQVAAVSSGGDDTQNEKKCLVTLADGATFELRGICETPSAGKTWWRPDGAPLAIAPDGANLRCQSRGSSEGWLAREFVFAVRKSATATVNARCLSAGEQADNVQSVAKVVGKVEVTKLAPQLRLGARATLVVDYASGEWKTIGVCPPAGGTGIQRPGGGILFSRPSSENKGSMRICVAIDCDEGQIRVVALDQESKEYLASNSDADASPPEGPFRMLEERFELPLRQIKEFRLQVRPWTRIEFRNISLHRGQKTNFDVLVDGKPYRSGSPFPAGRDTRAPAR